MQEESREGIEQDKSREGVGWAIATLFLGIGAVVSPHPLPKLFCSSGAIGTGTKAVSCFSSSAKAAYQQLAAPPEHRQLPAYTQWVRVSKNSSGPSQEIRPTFVGKRVGRLDLPGE